MRAHRDEPFDIDRPVLAPLRLARTEHPPLLDLTGGRAAFDVAVESGPAYEMIAELCAAARPAVPGEPPRPWWRAVRGRVADDLVRDVRELDGGHGAVWKVLLGIVHALGAPHDVGPLLGHLARMAPEDLLLPVVEAACARAGLRPEAATVVGAVRDDPSALAALVAEAAPVDASLAGWLGRLLGPPADEAAARVRALLRRWGAEVFVDEEPLVMPTVVHATAAQRGRLGSLSPWRLVDEATGGAAQAVEPGVKTVVLVASVAPAPWVVVADHGDTRLVLCPVAMPAAGERAEPPEAVLRVARALADPRRLRILHAVATGSASLGAVADHAGVVKSTAHHHLAVLQEAGLVTVSAGVGAPAARYLVCTRPAESVAELLDGYLGIEA